MDQPSPLEPERYALESQIRECYGRCAYTHKTHEKMAERLHSRHKRGKWANIILSALITGGAVSVIFSKGSAWEGYAGYATAALSILGLIFNAYLKDLDPGALAQRHRETASDMWNVREAYLSLITDILDHTADLGSLRERREALQADLYKIYHAAPHTDGKAYGKAQDALKNNEDLTFTETEIDVMLPPSLRRSERLLIEGK
ncbi:MAG: SLATT domain-containing protein [Mesorhizobium sp.]|uniref:SLATT domain-containing protein n=1 Tax=Mesorhizobium sp. TaxID=1871066 RepID=UPI001210A576|nr:SLATT domain-containing protein [Mesorhizobium sp.]TIL95145.1 MAG: SLATT domain-containing protein [Mesorhizobium sp.]